MNRIASLLKAMLSTRQRQAPVVLALGGVVGIGIFAAVHFRHSPQPYIADTTGSTRAVLSSFAVTKTLASQPESTKQTFLNQAANSMGFERNQPVTSDTVVHACLGQNAHTLSSTITHERDYYRYHPDEVHHMAMAMQDYCYHTYSSDGSGAPMPMPMAPH